VPGCWSWRCRRMPITWTSTCWPPGNRFDFNSDTMLEMQALVDDMTANGLVDFSIADRDNVILMGLDPARHGHAGSRARCARRGDHHIGAEDGKWLMRASAPVRNQAGDIVGSVRMTVDAGDAQDFLDTLRNRLWLIGGLLALIGTAIAWGSARRWPVRRSAWPSTPGRSARGRTRPSANPKAEGWDAGYQCGRADADAGRHPGDHRGGAGGGGTPHRAPTPGSNRQRWIGGGRGSGIGQTASEGFWKR